MSDIIIIQDSALNQKDMIYDLERYITSRNNKYNFLHNANYMFALYEDNGVFTFGHRIVNISDKAKPEFAEYFNTVDMTFIKEMANKHGNCYVMSEVPHYVDDKTILKNLKYYARLDNTHFIDCQTNDVVTRTDDNTVYFFNFFTVFKFKTLPIYTIILNSNAISNNIEEKVSIDKIIVSKNDDYLKNKFFDIKFNDVEAIIGKTTVFVKNNTIRASIWNNDVVDTIKQLPAAEFMKLFSIKTNIPFSFNGYEIELNFSELPPMSTTFFRIEIHVHDFMERFIYESQRPYFEYSFYKM